MNVHIFEGTEITTGRRKPSAIVAEYEAKTDALEEAFAAYEQAQTALKMACTIGGTHPYDRLPLGHVTRDDMRRVLLKSAWRHIYEEYKLPAIIPASDKRRIEMMFEKPLPFTLDNIRETFGDHISDPWGTILRGLAEVFANLDPAFKSH